MATCSYAGNGASFAQEAAMQIPVKEIGPRPPIAARSKRNASDAVSSGNIMSIARSTALRAAAVSRPGTSVQGISLDSESASEPDVASLVYRVLLSFSGSAGTTD